MPKIPLLATGATALVLGLAACGGSSSSSSQSSSAAGGSTSAASSAATSSSAAAAPAAGGGALSLAAAPSGQLAFTTTTLTAKAGTVKIDFTNKAPEGHNLTIQQGTSGPVVGATPTFTGGSKTLTVKLKPGTYTFYCTVPGHRAGGMQGTITVS
jgi:plastocyanin